MPATRPTNADPKPRHDEDTNVIDQSGVPFSMHFDRLVIAVGAYSQSDYLIDRVFFFSFADKSCCSFRRTWGQRTRPFSERCQGRPENTRSYLGMSVILFLLSLIRRLTPQQVLSKPISLS